MTEVKFVYGNVIQSYKLPNPEELTYELLIDLVPRLFDTLPKSYTLHYLINKSLTPIKNRQDIREWFSKNSMASALNKAEDFASVFKLYVIPTQNQ